MNTTDDSTLPELLHAEGVLDLAEGVTKEQALSVLGRAGCAAAGVPREHVDEVLAALREREDIVSTGIGLGLAVPHVRHEAIRRATIRVGRARAGIDFDALDRKPVRLVFLVLLPPGQHRRQVRIAAEIVRALKSAARRDEALAAPDAATFVRRLLSEA